MDFKERVNYKETMYTGIENAAEAGTFLSINDEEYITV